MPHMVRQLMQYPYNILILDQLCVAKFKCTVPGTLTFFDECHISTGKLITSHTELKNSSTTVPKTTVTTATVTVPDRVDTDTDIGDATILYGQYVFHLIVSVHVFIAWLY